MFGSTEEQVIAIVQWNQPSCPPFHNCCVTVDSSGASMFSFNRIADIQRGVESEGDTQLVYIEGESAMVVFPGTID